MKTEKGTQSYDSVTNWRRRPVLCFELFFFRLLSTLFEFISATRLEPPPLLPPAPAVAPLSSATLISSSWENTFCSHYPGGGNWRRIALQALNFWETGSIRKDTVQTEAASEAPLASFSLSGYPRINLIDCNLFFVLSLSHHSLQ